MQCGEKDPFVDDTVIFAGRVREAKRTRKAELDLLLSGKSARFGESLRMSSIDAHLDSKTLNEMKKERDKLAGEEESDWVQMVLFSDWSHGYLQMPTLMSEAKAVSFGTMHSDQNAQTDAGWYFQVIEELAEWIDHAFGRYDATIPDSRERTSERAQGPTLQAPKVTISMNASPLTSETETDDTGITFVPRRQGVSPPRARSTSSSGSEGTAGRKEEDSDGKSAVPEQARMQTPSTPRQTGQTISESELMRRRRLLDVHIYEQ
jgi:hypothetical protein